MASEVLYRGALPRLRWGPVIAGVLCALAIEIVLGLLGAAFGFAAVPGGRGLGVMAAIWTIVLTPLVALFFGALIAVRMAAAASEPGSYLHGALVWAIAMVAGAALLAGSAISGASAGASMAVGAGTQALGAPGEPDAGDRAAARGAAAASGAVAIGAIVGLGAALLGAAAGRRMLGAAYETRAFGERRGDVELGEGTGVARAERGEISARSEERPRADDPTLPH